jgi:hypothetical protein
MKLLSVSLGNRKGDVEVFGHVDVPNKTVKFQVRANELLVCEGDSYENMREVALEIVNLNQSNKERMN